MMDDAVTDYFSRLQKLVVLCNTGDCNIDTNDEPLMFLFLAAISRKIFININECFTWLSSIVAKFDSNKEILRSLLIENIRCREQIEKISTGASKSDKNQKMSDDNQKIFESYFETIAKLKITFEDVCPDIRNFYISLIKLMTVLVSFRDFFKSGTLNYDNKNAQLAIIKSYRLRLVREFHKWISIDPVDCEELTNLSDPLGDISDTVGTSVNPLNATHEQYVESLKLINDSTDEDDVPFEETDYVHWYYLQESIAIGNNFNYWY